MDREEIWALVAGQREFAVAARRHLHQHPELSFEEHETAAYIERQLAELGLSQRRVGRAGTGIVAVLEGDLPGATVALRADIDALPVREANELPFRSEVPDVMHACGHDTHTAILLGVARALAASRHALAGRVVFLFQHAEELAPGGALELVEGGCLDGVDAVYGLHQAPSMDVGKMDVAPGVRMAAAATFELRITGRGGHGGMPHLTVDPVQVAALVVTALHQIVGRRFAATDGAVLTVGSIHGGTAANVVPSEVTMTGTVRALSPAVAEAMPRLIGQVASGVAEAWGARAELIYEPGYPVLVNPPYETAIARAAAVAVLGEEAMVVLPPLTAVEDFAYYLQRVPGCFVKLGSATPSIPVNERAGTHSAAFMFDEEALPVGMAWFLSLVLNYAEISASLG